ncbi:MAG: TRAM domain-containing protein [Sedimentisphaerales bacterium]|nr:TRAM domain-containing protein [Sedimentisphaerales bacterium]
MLLWILRAIFWVVLVAFMLASVSSMEIARQAADMPANFIGVLIAGFGMGAFVFMVDALTPRRKLGALAGVFFGLIVGLIISGVLAPIVDMINDSYAIQMATQTVTAIKWIVGICICYLTISIVIRTKDDIRFVIPYVEFAKQTKGARPLVLDTSAIVDGRISDLCANKFFDAPVIVPRFVLNELQLIADSADKLKRNRGRRGLDVLNKMQASSTIDVEIDETNAADIEEAKGVDQKLLLFAKACNGRIATTDYNLTKVAQVRGVDVVNVNDLANLLKVVVLPGEQMQVRIVKPGEEADQGIGYLDDGTMVVVENGRNKIGRDVAISVTSSLQTSAGKMIFGRFESFLAQDENGPSRRSSARRPASTGA